MIRFGSRIVYLDYLPESQKRRDWGKPELPGQMRLNVEGRDDGTSGWLDVVLRLAYAV